jgi:hypothetical protein
VFVRGLHWGQGEREGSLAEKALFSSIFGKLTKKTFARVYKQVIGYEFSGHETLRLLLRHHDFLATMERCTACRKSMTDFRVSRKRGKSLYKFIH